MYCHILWALYQASQKPGFRTQTVKKKRLCEEWFKIKVIIFGGVILLKNCNLSIIHIHYGITGCGVFKRGVQI
jgi:hypothetical protein